MKMLTKATTLAVSILALTGTAYAATDSSSSQWPSFSQLDKNSDGVIEKKEARQAKGLNFKDADSDSDGKVSQSEYQTAMLKNGQGGTGSDSSMGGTSSSPGSSSGSMGGTGSSGSSSGSTGSSSDPTGSPGSTGSSGSGTYR